MKVKKTREKSISSKEFCFQSTGHSRSADEMGMRYGLRIEYTSNEYPLRRCDSIEKQHKEGGYKRNGETELAVVTAGKGEKVELNQDAQTATSIYATTA